MKFPQTLQTVGSERLADALREEIDGSLFHVDCLDRLCDNGGLPNHVESVDVHRIDDRPAELAIRATVYFTEGVQGACAGGSLSYRHAGIVEFTIDKSDGSTRAVLVDDAHARGEG